jgi:hypothetical protein
MAASQLEDSEARIKQIHAKFDKQTRRLQAKQDAVASERRECESEARTLAAARTEFAMQKRRDALQEGGYSRQSTHAQVQLATAEALRAALMEQTERRRAWAATAASALTASKRLADEIEKDAKALRLQLTQKASLEAQV